MVPENDGVGSQLSLKVMMAEYERALIVQALVACAGHQRRAAAVLGVLPTTLHEKMKRLGLWRRRLALPFARGTELGARP